MIKFDFFVEIFISQLTVYQTSYYLLQRSKTLLIKNTLFTWLQSSQTSVNFMFCSAGAIIENGLRLFKNVKLLTELLLAIFNVK
jgi:hypothetical protein